ncbi:hypothetical protein ACLB2K_061753 [Fragaria x ananassa]
MDDEINVSRENRFDFHLISKLLERDDPELLDPDVRVLSVDVEFYSAVLHLVFDHSPSADTVPRSWFLTDEKKTICGCDLRSLSSSISAANPNITPGHVLHDMFVNKIVSFVNKYSDPEYISRYKKLTVEVYITEYVYDRCQCEECRAIRESALMAEEKLIVPASESSIKKLLKKIRVAAAAGLEEDRQRKRSKSGNKVGARPSDSDGCTICCDEFTAGKYAAQMPCLHSFHKPCIQKWLRRSHYCPMCRYEMPVAGDGQEDG